MSGGSEPALDLSFLDESKRLRQARAKRRARTAIGVSVSVTVLWLAYVTVSGQWGRVADGWAAAVTMVFGSFVAGSTPQGGGAVAFPVFTKALEVPSELARTFSLSIQAIGMGAASLAIIINRRRVAWRAVAIGLPAAATSFLVAIWLLGEGDRPFRPPVIPGPYIKVSFTLVVGAMALMTYLGARIRIREVQRELPRMNYRTYTALVVIALIGGLAAALTGSGADVFIYLYLGVLLAMEPKIGVPTSVIVMTGISLIGFLVLGVLDGQLAVALSSDGSTVVAVGGEAVANAAPAGADVRPVFGPGSPLDAGKADLFGLWLAAAPVVAWGAPLGSWVAARLKTRQLVVFVTVLAALEIVTTLIFLPELYDNPALAAYGLIGAAVVGTGLWWLGKNRRRFFALSGVKVDRSLSRGHLDVADDYREGLEPPDAREGDE